MRADAVNVPTTLEETTQEDATAEAWDQWMAARKDNPRTECVEAPITWHRTIRNLRGDMSWVAREISDQEKGLKVGAGRQKRRRALLKRMGKGSRRNRGT